MEKSSLNQNCENYHNQIKNSDSPIPKSQISSSIKNKLYKSEMLRKAYRGCLEAVQLHLSPRNELQRVVRECDVKCSETRTT